MSLIDVLKEVGDTRSGSKNSLFNGFLEDFLNQENAQYSDILQPILELDGDCRIIYQYKSGINPKVVSNQIIRYKDAFKLPSRSLNVEMILYSENDGSPFALILSDYDYIISKGLYYCLTEQDALLEAFRNDVLVMSLNSDDDCASYFALLMRGEKRIGAIQRQLDQLVFQSFAQLKPQIIALAEQKAEAIRQQFEVYPQTRAPHIHQAVATWFLLRKVMYVQYMVDKKELNEVNLGDIKVHRQKAKENTDEVLFIPYSDMWRM